MNRSETIPAPRPSTWSSPLVRVIAVVALFEAGAIFTALYLWITT